MKSIIPLWLCSSLILSPSIKAQDFSILYLATIPVAREAKVPLDDFQPIGGGMIFGGQHVKGIIKFNYFTSISDGLRIENIDSWPGNWQFNRVSTEGVLFSAGVALYTDSDFFFAIGPTYASYSIFYESNRVAYRVDVEKEFTDQFGVFAGFGFHVGDRFRMMFLYEQITGSISPGISLSL